MTTGIAQQFATIKSLAETPNFSDYAHRIARLKSLQRLLQEQEQSILDALAKDLGKSPFEAYLTEIALVNDEINYTLKKLKRWLKPENVSSPLATLISSSSIVRDPLGTVLIIAPWNYPFQLLVAPLIGALAAGNAIVLKPSELAPQTSALIASLIPRYFPQGEVMVIEGAQAETSVLADLPFDHIFFTGSTRVGSIIMAQAARNLTPVTLELGGKSPCVLLTETHLDKAVRRIVWGKQLNSGQTCVAPDYLLIKKGLQTTFVERYRFWLKQFYGEEIIHSPDTSRIVSPQHFKRLEQLLDGHTLLFSSDSDSETLKFGPTLVAITKEQQQSALMEEEIFGPILPIVEIDDLADAIAFINKKPKPLAAYLFSDSAQEQDHFIGQIRAGGLCINDVVVHLSNKHLPFGGAGASGTGAYHGYHSFTTFTHPKAVMKRSFLLESALRYFPSANKLATIRKLLPWLG